MITGLHHAQLTIPTGREGEARAFYCGVLGMVEVEKPASLRGRGGFWLAAGGHMIHVGAEDGVDRAATKAHLAYAVNDIAFWRRTLRCAGIEILEGVPIPGHDRFEFRDPFGNRVELIQPTGIEASIPRVVTPPAGNLPDDRSGTVPRAASAAIRPFRPADEPAVIALWASVFAYPAAHNDPAAAIRRKLAVDPELFLVAASHGTVVGTVMAGYDGHRGWIYSLAVHPTHRSRGIGSALVRAAERLLAARGCPKVNLQLLASNARTAAFYEQLGYVVEDRINMGKRL